MITHAPPRRALALEPLRDTAAWDAFVAAEKTATFCHLTAWRDIMTDVLGHECIYRLAVDHEGDVRAVLPLVRMRSRLLGHHLVSMPFLNYGGAVGDSEAVLALVRWALAEAQHSGAAHVELRTRYPDGTTGAGAAARSRITVLLDLPAHADLLWSAGFSSKLRSQIRRPLKDGLEPRFGAEQMGAFYEVFGRNMRDLGTPVLPRALFERLPRAFGDDVLFGAVYHGDVPVAAGCGFLRGDEFEMTWASALREWSRSAPNMLLYWAFMSEVIGRGARTFNFGRCAPASGTHRFKAQWGGRDVPLAWSAWPPAAAAAMPSADNGPFALASTLWRRLPLPVANAFGPVLARRIPTF